MKLESIKEEPEIKADKKFLYYLTAMIIGGIGFLWICFYLISGELNETYPDITGMILGSFFGVFGFLGLLSILSFDDIYIFSDRLKVKSILGYTKKIIYLNDIKTWTEIRKQNEYINWTDLVIYTDKTNYKLSSHIYHNYEQLRDALIKGKTRNIKIQNKWFRRNSIYYGIAFTIFGCLSLYGASYFYKIKDIKLNYSDLTTITDVITNKVEIQIGSKGSRSINIKLKKYPDFLFDISGLAYYATYENNYIANVKKGDTISINIKTDEYLMKLTKEKTLGFWDKTVNYKFISIYGLFDSNFTYLTLSDYNKGHKSDRSIEFWLFGSIGLLLLGAGLHEFIKKT